MKKVFILQHVFYEGPGVLTDLLHALDYHTHIIHLYNHDALPKPEQVDGLVVMGGPMGVYDESDFPWLEPEKQFIKACLQRPIPVLGVCLGAQLLAEALGSPVYRATQKEIGWFPVSSAGFSKQAALFKDKPVVFHWHGDTFDLPAKAERFARSAVCENQAFVVDGRIVGLQFHVEVAVSDVRRMVSEGKSELIEAPYVQSEQEIMSNEHHCASVYYLAKELVSELFDRKFRKSE